MAQFDADTLLSGVITFNNSSPLLNVTGNMLARRQNIAATGDITVGPAPGAPGVSVFALGPQSITAGGALRLQGGDADIGYVEVGSFGRLSVATGSAGHGITRAAAALPKPCSGPSGLTSSCFEWVAGCPPVSL